MHEKRVILPRSSLYNIWISFEVHHRLRDGTKSFWRRAKGRWSHGIQNSLSITIRSFYFPKNCVFQKNIYVFPRGHWHFPCRYTQILRILDSRYLSSDSGLHKVCVCVGLNSIMHETKRGLWFFIPGNGLRETFCHPSIYNIRNDPIVFFFYFFFLHKGYYLSRSLTGDAHLLPQLHEPRERERERVLREKTITMMIEKSNDIWK